MVQYVLKRVNIAGRIAFEPPADLGATENIKRELRKCRDKHNDYVLVTMQPPKRPRTTGENSQNHHLNGHIHPIGESESSTDECALLIEAAHVLAADLGIILQE